MEKQKLKYLSYVLVKYLLGSIIDLLTTVAPAADTAIDSHQVVPDGLTRNVSVGDRGFAGVDLLGYFFLAHLQQVLRLLGIFFLIHGGTYCDTTLFKKFLH